MFIYFKSGIPYLVLIGLLSSNVNGEHFQFPDTDPCEIVDIEATLHLSYEDKDGKRQDAPLFTIDGATIQNASSSCRPDDVPSILNLELLPSGEKLSLSFTNINNKEVQMSVFFRMEPSKHFSNLNESATIMDDDTHLKVGDPGHSYKCVSEQVIYFSNQSSFYMNMTIKNVQLQAFHVQNSSYSPATECDQGIITTEEPMSTGSTVTSSQEPTTSSSQPQTSSNEPQTSTATEPETTMPTTQPIPTTVAPSRHHYAVKDGNITCLVMDATITFTIPYYKKDNTKSNAVIALPQDANITGSCNSGNLETLTVFFFTGNIWVFTLNVKGSGSTWNELFMTSANDITYSWQYVVLTYYIDSHFPDARDISEIPQGAQTDDLNGMFKGTSQGSYRCQKSQTIAMQNVTMTISNFQYRAFGTTDSETYPTNNVAECSSPKKKNDTGKTIGIIVGSVCGGLIIIAVVVFLIVRHRRKTSYKELQ